MGLYTILIAFEDRTMGIDQFEAESPAKALEEFVNNAESLEEYDRKKILSILSSRHTQDDLLMHVANNLRGFWIINFRTDFLNIPELSSIYGGYIIQTDSKAPRRTD